MELPNIPYYHIDRLISKGGTAAVYRGIDLRSGFEVAIKALYPSRAQNAYILKHFREEANNYLYLSHPNLTRLVDFIEHKGAFYLVMEFVDGMPLDLFIEIRRRLIPVKTMVDMFMQILDTVAYLHQNDKLHLDIKPSNIMVLGDNSVKLLDMGISIKLGDRDVKAAGTPPFMPPEQVAGKGICRSTDIFALGVTFFQMLTGRLPFTGGATTIIELNKHGKRPSVHELNHYVNPAFQDIIERAMAPDSDKRYQTCEEMMFEIAQLSE